MFLANFIFFVSHLKIHPAVHLNASKALTSLQSKRKILLVSLLAFLILMFYLVLKKDKMVAERQDVQIEQTRILLALVTIMTMFS